MTLAGLAVRNLARNKFRAALTVLGVAITVVAFLLLRAVAWAWSAGPEVAPKDRIVTRHRISLAMALPKRYVETVRTAPHVKAATWANWFGGNDPRHEHEIFATLAIDPGSYFDVYSEIELARSDLDRFRQDRQGAVVGDLLARRFGWKVGDRIVITSGLMPGDWIFTIDGIYTAHVQAIDRASFLLDWHYVNDAVPARFRDMVGWIVSRVDDPNHAAQTGLDLDKMFEEQETQTRSQDEQSFNASFLGTFSAVLRAMDIVSAVILGIMTLVLGNTVAMGVRERTGEYGVLLAVGFMPRHIALWIVAEALLLGVMGGVVGSLMAWPVIDLLVARVIEDHMASFFPYFALRPAHVAVGIGLSAVLGAAASAISAWNASRLRVVDAVRRTG